MNENEKPLSDFISSPSQWDAGTTCLVFINILFLIIIIAGIFLLITGSAVPVISWLKGQFSL